MADNITTTTSLSGLPNGTVIATDDAGAAGHVQLVKLAQSADGSATPVTADANGVEVQGAGVAGTPAGGVMSVQGVSGGTPIPVSQDSASTATLTNVSGSATSVQILASNAARRGVVIHNDSTAILRIKFGATASATSYTYKLDPDATLELPQPIYNGQIDGIWASATGAARVTELT